MGGETGVSLGGNENIIALMNERRVCRERLLAGVEWMGITGKTNGLIAWSESDLERRKGWHDSITHAAITEWGGGGSFSVFGQYRVDPSQEKKLTHFIGGSLVKSVWSFLNDAGGNIDCLILERNDTGSGNVYYGWVPDSYSRGDPRTSANFLAVSLKAEDAEWLKDESVKRIGFPSDVVLPGLYPSIEVPLEKGVVLDALRASERYYSVVKSFSTRLFLERLIEQKEGELLALHNKLPFFKRISTTVSPALIRSSEIDYRKMMVGIWGSVRTERGDLNLAGLLDLTEEDIEEAFGKINVKLTRDNYERSAGWFYDACWRVVREGILRKPDEFVRRAQRVSVHRRANPNVDSLLIIEVDDKRPWSKELSGDELRKLIVS